MAYVGVIWPVLVSLICSLSVVNLRGGCNLVFIRKTANVCLDFFRAHFPQVAFVMKAYESPYPFHRSLFGAIRVMSCRRASRTLCNNFRDLVSIFALLEGQCAIIFSSYSNLMPYKTPNV